MIRTDVWSPLVPTGSRAQTIVWSPPVPTPLRSRGWSGDQLSDPDQVDWSRASGTSR